MSSLQKEKLPAASLLLSSLSSGVVSLSGEAEGSGRLWWEVVRRSGRTGWHAAALARKRWPHTLAAWATLTTVWNLDVSVKLTWTVRIVNMFLIHMSSTWINASVHPDCCLSLVNVMGRMVTVASTNACTYHHPLNLCLSLMHNHTFPSFLLFLHQICHCSAHSCACW